MKVDSLQGYIDMKYVVLDNGVEIQGDGNYDGVVHNATAGQILHLRQRPETKSKSLGNYHNGTYVEILDVGTEWLHVVVDNKDGYMMSQYVTIITPGISAEHTALSTSGSSVPLYASASDKGEIISQLDNGTVVTVVTPNAQWSQVQVMVGNEQKTGYIQNDQLHMTPAETPEYTEFTITG